MAFSDLPPVWASGGSAVLSDPGTVRTAKGWENGKVINVGQVNYVLKDITEYLDLGEIKGSIFGNDAGQARLAGSTDALVVGTTKTSIHATGGVFLGQNHLETASAFVFARDGINADGGYKYRDHDTSDDSLADLDADDMVDILTGTPSPGAWPEVLTFEDFVLVESPADSVVAATSRAGGVDLDFDTVGTYVYRAVGPFPRNVSGDQAVEVLGFYANVAISNSGSTVKIETLTRSGFGESATEAARHTHGPTSTVIDFDDNLVPTELVHALAANVPWVVQITFSITDIAHDGGIQAVRLAMRKGAIE